MRKLNLKKSEMALNCQLIFEVVDLFKNFNVLQIGTMCLVSEYILSTCKLGTI